MNILTDKQYKFLVDVIPYPLYKKYNEMWFDGRTKILWNICDTSTYTDKDKEFLNRLRKEYITEHKIKK